MIELQAFRKNKINLEDYDYRYDINTRLLMATFTDTDLEVLEEILYNSIEFPISVLKENLGLSDEELSPSLSKLESAGLFRCFDQMLVVDKEKRKYFELQIEKFDESFEPGMDFLQSLLKQVPIQVLPNWYHIPRNSNNIFHSLIEKYLITPQVFQRYLLDLQLGNDILDHIAEDLRNAPNHELSVEKLRNRYQLSHEEIEEYILLLEFNFVCCLSYRKEDDHWKEVITPFQEWKDYLTFLHTSIPNEHESCGVRPLRSSEYGFSEDLSHLLHAIEQSPEGFRLQDGDWAVSPEIGTLIAKDYPTTHCCHYLPSLEKYLEKLITKALLIQFIRPSDKTLSVTPTGQEWLGKSGKDKSIAVFKHPYNHLKTSRSIEDIHSDRNIHEVENSLGRIAKMEWILFNDFMKGVTVALREEKKVKLKKEGRKWRYSLPEYSEDEKRYIETTILDYLFESGIVQLGHINNEVCFKLTELGASLFDQ